MAKLSSETLAGVGLLDLRGAAAANSSGTVEAATRAPVNESAPPAEAELPPPEETRTRIVAPPPSDGRLAGDPVPSLVDTRRGVQAHERAEEPDDSNAVADSSAESEMRMADTQPGLGVKTRTAKSGTAPMRRSGTQVRVSTQNGPSLRPGQMQEGAAKPVGAAKPLGAAEPVGAAEPLGADAPSIVDAQASLNHDTLRGMGIGETPNFSQTLPMMRRPDPVKTTVELDANVFTSVMKNTLPIGTRLPKAIEADVQLARARGFATQPPITPKVLTRTPTADASAGPHTSASEVRGSWTTLPSERVETQAMPVQRTSEETFRPSAHTTPPVLADARRKRPNPAWALAAIPLGFAIALGTIKVDTTTTAPGVVVLNSGLTPAINQVAGPVVAVFVKAGDTVTAGQAIAEVDGLSLEQRRGELLEREAALVAEQERAVTLGSKWHTAATDALQRKRGLLWQRLKLRSDAADQLAKTNKEPSRSERDQVLLIRQELADVEFELNRREGDRDDQQRTWENRMSEVRLALAQVNTTSASVLAPVAGRVEALLVSPGQVLGAGSPVAQVVPEGASTQIVVLVPSKLAATLTVDSELAATFAALPPEQTGAVKVRVTRIADTNVTREEAASLLNAPLVEPMVRVDVALASPESEPQVATALHPGQRVQARVPGEKRSLWSHLLSRFQ